LRVAVVIPWFGKELKGGAEQHAWQVSTRLADKGVDVTVLTTCSKEFRSDWMTDYYEPGEYAEGKLRVIRFSLKARAVRSFTKFNLKLLAGKKQLVPGVSPLDMKEEAVFVDENINSPALIDYLGENRDKYDVFFFIPYLYGPIINGLDKVKDKAILQPCLHDEPYAYLDRIARIFHSARRIFYLSEGEYRVARKLYGPAIIQKSVVTGAGVETGVLAGGSRPATVDGEYVLCLGRKDKGKNTDLLVRAFDRYVLGSGSRLKLLLAGPADLPVKPQSSQVIDLGLVPEDEKLALLYNCKALVNPSANESFSRVIFEAWQAKKPVIVNRGCLATYGALEASGFAGWHADSEESFAGVFRELEAAPEEALRLMGQKGYEYARDNSDWDRIIDRYIAEMDALVKADARAFPAAKPKNIHQMLPNLAYGDAISNEAMFIKRLLLSKGFGSKIFVRYIDDKVAHECEVFSPDKLSDDDGLIYHHSIGSELTPFAARHGGKKALIYHNITPASFYEPYDKRKAKILVDGRRELGDLAPYFENSFGDSAYNVEELKESGFRDPSVLRIPVDPGRWNILPDRKTILRLKDGRKNIIFVGRIAPNKCQQHFIEMFVHLRAMYPDVRLCIVGDGEKGHPYLLMLHDLIKKHRLGDSVIISGKVTEAELFSYYRCADLFVSMSEHEGFGVPIVEAMWFDIPVLAYRSTAVPETMGSSGVLFDSKDDLKGVAETAKRILTDGGYRDEILRGQSKNRERFLFESVASQYDGLLETLGAEPEAVSVDVFYKPARRFRILVVKLDHLGDFLLAVPAMVRLKEKFADSEMDIVVGGWNVPLARRVKLFNEIHTYDFFRQQSSVFPEEDARIEEELLRRLGEYDVAIDLRRQGNTRFLLSKVHAKLKVGYQSFTEHDGSLDICLPSYKDYPGAATPMNEINTSLQLLELVEAIPVESIKLPPLSGAARLEGHVAMFPGAGSAVKQWPAENFAGLAKRLLEHDGALTINVYLAGSERELALAFEGTSGVNIHAGLDFDEYIDSVARNAVSVANNSFGSHISSYLGIPVVSIYGGQETVEEWGPAFGENIVLSSDVSCSPCHIPEPSWCKYDLICLKQITVDMVFEKVLDFLKNKRQKTSGVLTYLRKNT
jgi:glycosyltransferase involved in cell wall biosynthesis/ADP-heptose:LPS heptosyltransferase